MLVAIIAFTLVFSFFHEKSLLKRERLFLMHSLLRSPNGLQTGVKIFPYVLGMLVAISFLETVVCSKSLVMVFLLCFPKLVLEEITDSLPVAMLRPFSSGGSRGFMIDPMRSFWDPIPLLVD